MQRIPIKTTMRISKLDITRARSHISIVKCRGKAKKNAPQNARTSSAISTCTRYRWSSSTVISVDNGDIDASGDFFACIQMMGRHPPLRYGRRPIVPRRRSIDVHRLSATRAETAHIIAQTGNARIPRFRKKFRLRRLSLHPRNAPARER